MFTKKFFESFYPKFEKLIVISLSAAIMVAIVYATICFFVMLFVTIVDVNPAAKMLDMLNESQSISAPIARFQNGLLHIFSGCLLILLGLELVSSIKLYSKENHIKIESMIAVAIIASTRELIILDYAHTEPGVLFGVGFIVVSLVAGYVLLKLKPSTISKGKDSKR